MDAAMQTLSAVFAVALWLVSVRYAMDEESEE